MNRIVLLAVVALLATGSLRAQLPDVVYSPAIGSPQLYMANNQLQYPVLRLNSSDQMELHFDDLDDGQVKNYYYSFVLCNEDWTPAQVSEFDFIKGFSQMRIDNYTISSIALTRYTHYQAMLPDPNYVPIHSGNYLLKVFLDGDTSKLAFTKRFLVVDARTPIQSEFMTPQNPELVHTHQHIQFRVNTAGMNPPNPLDQIRVDVLQNYRWDNVVRGLKPTFANGYDLQYNNPDEINFEGGSEWRWIDLQSFRFLSDRVESAAIGKTGTDILAKPDADRSQLGYYLYADYNGAYILRTTEQYNPFWQTDYATVHFSFVPPGRAAFTDKDVYLLSRFTGGGLNDSTRMVFNPDHGRYERSFFMKEGYYSYSYVTVDKNDPAIKPSFAYTEGNHVETENDYMILIYYRALGSRADELVGISRFNTLNHQ
jgi:type 9 secretion system plug protein